MPHRCDPCDRSFAHKEALQAHLKSSSLEHPFCSICDRRFNCQSARDMHMANKHPPTFDCETCNRTFKSPAALQSHYRGHASHPNCARCGRGFKDYAERDEHQRPCDLCGIMLCEDTLKTHYTQSTSHPTCPQCEQGFRDESALSEHLTTDHPLLPEPLPESESVVAEAPTQPTASTASAPKEFPIQNAAVVSPQLSQVYATTTPISSPPMPPRPDVTTSPRLNQSFPAAIPPSLRAHIDVAASMRQDTTSPALILPRKYAAQIKDEQTPLFSPLSSLPPPESVPPGVWQNIHGLSSSENAYKPRQLYATAETTGPSPWRRPLPVTPNEIGRSNGQNLTTQTSPPRNVWAERSAMQAASLAGPSRPSYLHTSGIPVASRNVHLPMSSFPGHVPVSLPSYPTNDMGRSRGYSASASMARPNPGWIVSSENTTASTTPASTVTGLPTWRERMAMQKTPREGTNGPNTSWGNGGRDVNAMTNRLLAPSLPTRAESGSSNGAGENPWNIRLPASPPTFQPPMSWRVHLPSSHGSARSGSGSSGIQSPEVFSPFDLPALPPPPSVLGMSPLLQTPIFPEGDSFVHDSPTEERNTRPVDSTTTSVLLKESSTPSPRLKSTARELTPPQPLDRMRSPPRIGRDAESPAQLQPTQTPSNAHTSADTNTYTSANTKTNTQIEAHTQNPNAMANQVQSQNQVQTQVQTHARTVSASSLRMSPASVLDSLESVPTSFDATDSDDPWEVDQPPRGEQEQERLGQNAQIQVSKQEAADLASGPGSALGGGNRNGITSENESGDNRDPASPSPIPAGAFYTPEARSARASPIPPPVVLGESRAEQPEEKLQSPAEAQLDKDLEPESDQDKPQRPPAPTRTSTLLTLTQPETPPRPEIQLYEPKEPQTAISERYPGAYLGGISRAQSMGMTPAETFASPRVHCRLCKSDPCIEMTASMCGHLFCYRCITRHVAQHSECPVCQTPTLLYCLFRLHLYS